jgi:hypothetical protein
MQEEERQADVSQTQTYEEREGLLELRNLLFGEGVGLL